MEYKKCLKAKSVDKLDGLCSRSLRECGLEFSHSQPDDLISVLVVFDRYRQPFHVEIDLHVLKLKANDKRVLYIVCNVIFVFLPLKKHSLVGMEKRKCFRVVEWV